MTPLTPLDAMNGMAAIGVATSVASIAVLGLREVYFTVRARRAERRKP